MNIPEGISRRASEIEHVAKAMFPWAWRRSDIMSPSDNKAARIQAMEKARLAIEAIEAIARPDRIGP